MEENYPDFDSEDSSRKVDIFDLVTRKRRKYKWVPVEFAYDHEGDMPPDSWDGVLTKALVDRLATKRGAFTGATLKVLGVDPAFNAGWRRRLVGMKVTRAQYAEALRGRSIYA